MLTRAFNTSIILSNARFCHASVLPLVWQKRDEIICLLYGCRPLGPLLSPLSIAIFVRIPPQWAFSACDHGDRFLLSPSRGWPVCTSVTKLAGETCSLRVKREPSRVFRKSLPPPAHWFANKKCLGYKLGRHSVDNTKETGLWCMSDLCNSLAAREQLVTIVQWFISHWSGL
jgi:hypothetical protein